jgi:hypothetical protein
VSWPWTRSWLTLLDGDQYSATRPMMGLGMGRL